MFFLLLNGFKLACVKTFSGTDKTRSYDMKNLY